MKPNQLAALEKLARLKADRELKKLRALQVYVDVAQQRVEASRAAMAQSYSADAPLSVPEARMANAQAGRAARDLGRARQELRKLEPQYRALQQQAAREFGRAEAIAALGAKLSARNRSEC